VRIRETCCAPSLKDEDRLAVGQDDPVEQFAVLRCLALAIALTRVPAHRGVLCGRAQAQPARIATSARHPGPGTIQAGSFEA
jgi:hypothetical protein